MMRYVAAALVVILVIGDRTIAQEPSQEERQVRFWANIKKGLTGSAGDAYWDALKGANLPGGANGLDSFEGMLVSSAPADHPNEFLVAMDANDTPEVLLKLNGTLERPLQRGTPIRFEGVAAAYTRDPFQLTLQVQTVNRAKTDEKKN
jgi:hypothetical protein